MEKILSVTTVRQKLMKLAKTANRKMERYVLTNRGQAEAVLIGYTDYRSLMAAARLAHHPEIMEQTRRGFAAIEEGRGLTLEQVLDRLAKKRTSQEKAVTGP